MYKSILHKIVVIISVAFILSSNFNSISLLAGKTSVSTREKSSSSKNNQNIKTYQKPKDLKPEIRIIDGKKILDLESDLMMPLEYDSTYQ
jgi:hypothetical protein